MAKAQRKNREKTPLDPNHPGTIEASSKPDFRIEPFSLLVFAIVSCVAVAFIYGPSINAPFVFDSIQSIEKNSRIESLWAGEWFHGRRWLVYFSFAVDNSIHGRQPWGFCLTNMIVFWLGGLVLYQIINGTLLSFKHQFEFDSSQANSIAFLSAFSWIVHPLNTQCVVYHVQRMESLMGLFLLLSIYCTMRSMVDTRRKYWWWSATALACAISMQCKEVGYMSPLVLMTYYHVFSPPQMPQTDNLRSNWMIYGLFLCCLTAIVSFAAFMMSENRMGLGDNLAEKSWRYLLSQPEVICFYVQLLFFPIGQNIDHAWLYADTVSRWLIPGVVVTAMLFSALYLTWKRRPLGFCLISFFLILAPTSSILPVTDLAVEHRMYLPSSCLIVIAAFVCLRFSNRYPKKAVIGICFLVILTLVVTARFRTEVWNSRKSIWSDSVAKAPHNPRGYVGLGFGHLLKKNFPAAISAFEKGYELYQLRALPNFDYSKTINQHRVLLRLGDAHLAVGNLDRAKRYFDKYLKFEEATFENMLLIADGAMAVVFGFNESIPYFERAIQLADDHQDKSRVQVQYGIAALKGNQVEEAQQILLQAVENDRSSWRAHNFLAVSYAVSENHQEQAIYHFEEAIKLSDNDPEPVANLRRLKSELPGN